MAIMVCVSQPFEKNDVRSLKNPSQLFIFDGHVVRVCSNVGHHCISHKWHFSFHTRIDENNFVFHCQPLNYYCKMREKKYWSTFPLARTMQSITLTYHSIGSMIISLMVYPQIWVVPIFFPLFYLLILIFPLFGCLPQLSSLVICCWQKRKEKKRRLD